MSRTAKRREVENSQPFLLARLAAKSARNEATGCVEWQGYCRPNGYAWISINDVAISVHRLSYELNNGPIPSGLCVCHRCDNRRCLNPEHLFLGTRSDNSLDAVRKGRFPTHPPPKLGGQTHPQAKLSDAEVREIRQRLESGDTGLLLARLFGVTPTQISRIKLGKARPVS